MDIATSNSLRSDIERGISSNGWVIVDLTPVEFIENASRAEQRVVVSSVDAMQRDAATQQIKAPTLMIIGNVASSAAELQWFGQRALTGDASA